MFLLLFASPAAIGGTSWSNRPNWAKPAQGAQQSYGQRGVSQQRRTPVDDRKDISPFSPTSHNVSLGLGQIFLFGKLGKTYSDSIGYQVHYNYGVSDIFAFDTGLEFSSHPEKTNTELGFSLGSARAGLRTNLSWFDKLIPYGVFGLGFYRPTYDITDTYAMTSMLFGIHLGVGADLELTRNLFFGAALSFHDILGTTKFTEDGAPFDVGGTYTAFLLRGGVTF